MPKQKCWIGLDLSDSYAIVSYYRSGMQEPETISTVAGSDIYQIPVLVGKKREMEQWVYGEEAGKLALNGEGECVGDLLSKTQNEEKVTILNESYAAIELFALFLKKCLSLPGKLQKEMEIEQIVISVEAPDKILAQRLRQIMKKIGISTKICHLQEHRESFYYYVFSQKKEIWTHDVALFHLKEDQLGVWMMHKDLQTRPIMVEIDQKELGQLGPKKDQTFEEHLKRLFEGRLVSAVFLIGEEFEGNWMKQCVPYLCQNRKVYMGKNLFSLGACCCARQNSEQEKKDWPFLYMGMDEIKVNLGLYVRDESKEQMLTMITAGENWYEAYGECEIILQKDPEIDMYLQHPQTAQVEIKTLELLDLPERPERMTRLRIEAEPFSDHEVQVRIRDLGFGEIIRSTERVWNYTLTL